MTEHKVVDLVDAGVPADQGLSSLGLIMQLAGSVLAAAGALLAFRLLLENPRGDEALWLFLILGISIARSMLHRAAGAQLLYGTGSLDGTGKRLAGIRRYVMFGVLQSIIVGAIFGGKFHMDTSLALGVMAGLAAWPAALSIMLALPRFKRFADDLPITEDKGFEGASIIMTVLGMCGLVGSGALLLLLLEGPSELQRGPGVLIILSTMMLVVRSFIHVQAGMSGLRETSIDRSVSLANRYANFGVISSFCVGGAILLFAIQGLDLVALVLVCGMVWLLMAWPMIVRRFFADRQFSELLAGDNAPLHRRAPDAGLTGLGWLLVALAFMSASFLIPEVVMAGRHGARDVAMLLSFAGGNGARSVWWPVGLCMLQAWAGYELVRMSAPSRIIATVYGLVGIAVTIYVQWPMIEMMRHSGGMPSDVATVAPVVLSLIVPVATLLLVNRKIAPTARARFKAKP